MSANFLDKSWVCVGVDNHMYFTVGPYNVPVPVKMVPHAVAYAHFLASKSWRIAHTVTTGGWATLQGNWAMLLVPHVPPMVPPPHPAAEPANLAVIDLTASSTPQLTAHSVTGEGQALLTCLYDCGGINIDCGDMPFPGAMMDVNVNSVKTSPTLGDYLAAIFSAVCSVGYAWAGAAVIGDKIKAADKLVEIIAQALASLGLAVVQTVLDYLAATVNAAIDVVNFIINWVAAQVQSATDAPAPALGH